MNQNVFRTKSGAEIIAFHREGKNDWNTLQSIIVEDEYNLNEIVGGNPGCYAAIDLGAHIGGFSLLAASMGIPVLSVECLPENVLVEVDSIEANKFGSLIFVKHAAISRSSGKFITVSYNDTSSESGNHHEFVGGSVTHAGGRSIDAETVSLPDCVKDILGRVKDGATLIVKTDCEGAEWEAFKNLPNAVLERIDWIVGEIHPLGDNKSLEDFIKLFRNKFDDVSSQYRTFNGSTDLCTFVFKRKVK